MNITHALQIPADGLLVDPVLGGKLRQCLLAIYIVGNYLIFVPTSTDQKMSSTVFSFIQLFFNLYCGAGDSILLHGGLTHPGEQHPACGRAFRRSARKVVHTGTLAVHS